MIMKAIITVCISLIIAIIVFSNMPLLDKNLLNLLFTVGSIFFSLGLSIVVTFDLSKITNQEYLIKLEQTLTIIRRNFLRTFYISIIVLIIAHMFEGISINLPTLGGLIPSGKINLSILGFSYTVIIGVLIIYILNFLSIEKFRKDLDKKIRTQS